MTYRSQIYDGTKWIGMTGGDSTTDLFDFLHSEKSSADTPDDEFDSTTLDAKWTAVDGAAGTVDMLLAGSTVTEVYDLTTRPGWLLMQVGTADTVSLRQDFELPDGESIVVAVSVAAGDAGDNQSFRMAVNDVDTTATSGEYLSLMLEQDSGEWAVQCNSDTDATGNELIDTSARSSLIFLRIMRSTLDYSGWISYDGMTWTFVFSDTHADLASNIWLTFVGSATTMTFAQVAAIPWIRQGTNELDPWTPTASASVTNSLFEGSWVQDLIVRPDAAHADDQEFTGTIEGTAITPTGTATWTQDKSLLSLECDDQSTSDVVARAYALTPTTFPVTLEASVHHLKTDTTGSQNVVSGLFFSDGVTATDNMSSIMVYHDGTSAAWEGWHGTFTNVATSVAGLPTQDPAELAGRFYVRIIWDTTNSFEAQGSYDGVTWFAVTAGWADTITPTHFGVFGSTWAGTSPNHVAWDYIRVTESDLSA